MREIKFRGKRVDNGEWKYGYFVEVNDKLYIFKKHIWWEVAPETVGQFTGLRDRNGKGKEVYDGDLSTLNSAGLYECKWSRKHTAFMWEEKDSGDVEKTPEELVNMIYFCGDVFDFEVIGNVTEHPELLKQGSD